MFFFSCFFFLFLNNMLDFTVGACVLGFTVGGCFTVSAGRLSTTASNDPGRNKTTDFSFRFRCFNIVDLPCQIITKDAVHH